MKIGDRLHLYSTFTEDHLAFVRQLGADGVVVNVASATELNTQGGEIRGQSAAERLQTGDFWETDDLASLRKQAESSGLELFAVAQPPYHRYDKIIRGLPGRDQQIENWCRSLRNAGAAGIPIMMYGWVINVGARWANWRTSASTPSRGGSTVTSFDYELAKDTPVSEIGRITEEEMWDNLTYFLKAVIPVAQEAGVKMAMHPADPQVPQIAGIARIVRSPEAYRRVFDIAPSDYNTMTFCQGCFSQMLDPDGVYEAIRYFGSRNKIAFVHFRNVRGTKEKFAEAWWDDGKVSMAKAIKAYQEVGYNGYLTPDHHPFVIGDTKWGHRARAFAIGYTRGLLQRATVSA